MRKLTLPVLLFLLLGQAALASVPMDCFGEVADTPCHSVQDESGIADDTECQLRCGQCASGAALEWLPRRGISHPPGYSRLLSMLYLPPDLVEDAPPPIPQ